MSTQLLIDTRDAILSGAWSYPLLGISYFATHPRLYQLVLPTIVKSLVASVTVTGCLIFFTYSPQVAFCAKFSAFFAPITAAIMVIGEAYILLWSIGKPMMMARIQDTLFDEVMVQQGHGKLIAKGREVHTQAQGVKVLGKKININPDIVGELSREGVLRYLTTLPLNCIPGIGTAIFLVYNGEKQGPGFHARYLDLKGWDRLKREEFVRQRRPSYVAFGAVALALDMMPFVGLVFELTTVVGAALWASRLEERARGDNQ